MCKGVVDGDMGVVGLMEGLGEIGRLPRPPGMSQLWLEEAMVACCLGKGLSQPRTLSLGRCWITRLGPEEEDSSSILSLIRSGEKQILGESMLTCGEDMEECGDRPDAGLNMSSSTARTLLEVVTTLLSFCLDRYLSLSNESNLKTCSAAAEAAAFWSASTMDCC